LIQIPLVVGRWPYPDLPRVVQVRGHAFERRDFGFGGEDVIAEYQEAVPTLAAHLYVMRDGTYQVDHVDDFNPSDDPIGHFVVDVLQVPREVALSLLTGSVILPLV
jgi:hypothetical protein